MSKVHIYNGPSKSFSEIENGYIDYSMEVICRRAIPDLRDGFKPVQRRTMYAMYELSAKDNYLKKCGTIIGAIMSYHPHGDSSSYGALCLLTDSNGSCNMPFLVGQGQMGKVFSSDKPAAFRYTKARMSDYSEILFKDADVMKYIPSEEGSGYEPDVLNAIYPVVLVNGSMGIAVAASTKMPSFNFNDVVDLTIKNITEGKLSPTDIIVPDFPSGGVLVCNKGEITKIMLTGKGKLKVRARVEISGKDINVIDVPVGKSAEGIVKTIKRLNFPDIADAIVRTGSDTNIKVVITCKSKKVVDQVLMELYRSNILQNTFSSNMLVVNDGVPMILGVHGVIREWCNWRRGIVKEKFERLLRSVTEEKHKLAMLINLINDEAMKDEFIRLATKQGRKDALNFLYENLEGVKKEEADWIYERGIGVFHRGGTYATRFEALCNSEQEWLYNINHIDEYIVNELQGIKKTMGADFPRKTEISYKDYKFSRVVDSDSIEDTSFCIYTLFKSGFLAKTRSVIEGDDVLCSIEAQANSVLVGFDNYGRVLRISGKDVPFSQQGIYLPKEFGVDGSIQEDFAYKILYMCECDGSKKALIYRDGYIGFFGTDEFVGKRVTRVINNGVPTAVGDKLLEICDITELPDYLLFADDTKDQVKIGVVVTSEILEKSRTSRTRVLTGPKDMDTNYVLGFNGFELAQFVPYPDNYVGKLKVFKDEFLGDESMFEEGTYVELCPNLN